MNELQNFSHSMFGNLGILIKDGKEFFPATDVAKTLGYSNPHKAIKDHCKSEGVNETLVPTNGGAQTKKFINEGNLYRLIVKSKLPQAEQFEKWVFEEVLPSIRKHGAYMTDNTLEQALTSPDFLIELATNLKHEQEARKLAESKVVAQQVVIDVIEPKAKYHDNVLDSKNSFNITEIAHNLNMTAQQLNKLLKDLRIQRKIGGIWVLYAEHQDKVINKPVEEEKEVRNKYIETLNKKDIHLSGGEKIPLLIN
ncbi:phage antirepressor [Bacillus toyonensis]|uniref:phage antirepressor n=1 Tax=Bacillus toyonensis TaxID=155322 RepID=UPI000BFE8EF6|nr:phage antirepressor [Bacillus toyonensis]PHA72685.1 DNA-binding protein [Bacillus toyonensis]